MSTRYIKGERFRVRSRGWVVPQRLEVDDATLEENRERVSALFASERDKRVTDPASPRRTADT